MISRFRPILVAWSVVMGLLVGPFAVGMSPAYAQESTALLTFPAAADAYVTGDDPETNFGAETHLFADEDGPEQGLLRFDVAGITGTVERATLRMWVTNGSEDAPELWYSPNSVWTEESVTWNTRPAVDVLVANVLEVAENSSLEYDVSNAVRGDGSYTFALIAEDNDGLDILSREAGGNPPELVIETSGTGGMATPAGEGAEVLLAAGDISTCDWEEDEYTARILDTQPGTIASLGDNVQRDGTEQEFTDCYDPTWGRHKERIKPAVGNHEYHSTDAEPYFAYFGEAAGEPGKGYYSYMLGSWQVIVLNSNIEMEAGSAQEVWLREQLEASPAVCTLAYWHHPRFSSGTYHGSNEKVVPLWDALYEHGAEIVLNGHEHIYERFLPQDPDGDVDAEHGIMQITASTGGAVQRHIGAPLPTSVVRSNTAHGVLRLELGEGRYAWQFLAIEGDLFSDAGEGACHDAPGGQARVGGIGDQAVLPDASGRVRDGGRVR